MKGMWIAISKAICLAMTLRAEGSTSFLDLRGASHNRTRDHPRPSFLETTRVDGVKAPPHDGTPRSHVRLDVLAVQAVAELLDAARDLVVAHDLLLAVALDDVDVVVVLGDAGLVPRQVRGPAVGGFVGILSRGRCLLYTSPSPRDATLSRMPSSA